MTREEYNKAGREGAWLFYSSGTWGTGLVRAFKRPDIPNAFLKLVRLATPNDMLKYEALGIRLERSEAW